MAAVLSAALACAVTGPARRAWDDPDVRRAWPEPPQPARIVYAGAIRSEADLGRAPGLLERMKRLIFGGRDTSLVKPVAIARNPTGLLAVADPSVPTVHIFDLERRTYRRLSEDAAALLVSPVGVAVDEGDRVYVTDSVAGRVFVFDRGGELLASFAGDGLLRPTGLALSPDQQRLYVVDTTACRITIFDPEGRELGRFGRRGVELGEFNAPTHVAVGRDGTIAVSDSLNFRVQLFRPDGTPVGAFGEPGDAAGTFHRPKGVALDDEGRIYVVDAAFENVQIFDRSGGLLLSFGGPGSEAGGFVLPSGLFLDSTRTLWVADSYNQRVQAFRLVTDE